ncbi:universal stress protein [Nocardia sp. NPDC057353]|uniref:universal stress protein n=1 Tax=Nocardia sp. NPDC057353 TaxID=3346104 RepID=UPI00363C5046
MPEPTPAPNAPIVAAVDGSETAYHAAAWAAVDARLHGRPLHLLCSMAVPFGYGEQPTLPPGERDWLRDEGERALREAARIAEGAAGGPITVTAELTFEFIVPTLLDRSHSAHRLVLGSRGLGAFRRGLLGSVSTAVTGHAHCPVVVVRTPAATDPVAASKPVLVGVDGTANSVGALELAFAEASFRGVGLTALHAWRDTSGLDLPIDDWAGVRASEEATLAESLAGYAERYPDVPVRRVVVADRPVRSLLDESANAQLVVVGSRGRGGFTGMLLGSTSNGLLHSVDIPIAVVRAAD